MKIEYIEMEVPCLSSAAQFYSATFHMRTIATYHDAEKTSYLLQHGNIKLVISKRNKQCSRFSNDDINKSDHSVNEIAFLTEDTVAQYNRAINLGQKALVHPFKYSSADDDLHVASVNGIGNIKHTFIQRRNPASNSLPHFQTVENIDHPAPQFELNAIDHIAVCVHESDLDKWVNLYESAYNFKQSYEEYVSTENSGMNSKVVESESGMTKIVFVAPISGKKQSQVADYLQYHNGPCVQHLAFSTSDILDTVKKLHQQGVEFLSIPDKYYEIQRQKLPLDRETFQLIQTLSILVDQQEAGYLYQIFTKPSSKPTLFFEIIQRTNCDGFGSGNIKALFQAIEQEQIQRDAIN